jgi:hypothetical protein
MAIVLQQEYDYFLAHLNEFMQTHANEFVVIKNNKVVGFFISYEKALRDGLARFGTQTPFFIKEIKEEETMEYHSTAIHFR